MADCLDNEKQIISNLNSDFLTSNLDGINSVTSEISGENSISSTMYSTDSTTSNLGSEEPLNSDLDLPSIQKYNGSETDNIVVTVDNKGFIISASVKQIKFKSFEDFPQIGSEHLIYIDATNKTLYGWDLETRAYYQLSSGSSGGGSSVNVYNGLDSDSITDALSAKQGKVLNEKKADKTELENYYTKTETDGIADTKVSRVTDEQPRYRFYGVKYNSTEDNVFNAYPGSAVKNWLAMYNSNGTLSAKDPTGDAHLTTKLYVDNAVSTIPKFSVEVVASLPTENISTTTVYLVASGSENQNLYIEYIYVNDTWEKLGEQRIDLSNYPTRTELQEILNTALQDYLTKELFNGFLTDINQDISDIKTNTTQIVGKNNQFTAGGALSANEYGVAIGKNSTTDFGVSIGASSESLAGGAVGFGAKTSDGFSGGFNAKAQDQSGNGIDAIQLGTGINSIPLSLQIYGDNIYKSSTHTLTVKNIELDGEDIKNLIDNSGGGSSSENSGSSLPVGSIFASAIPQTDARVHLLDGSTISQTGVYETFANLIKTLVSAGNNISCTQTEFDADVSATGNCGKFVIDNDAGTIRLPKITTFIQGLSNLTNIGSSLSAGLPNITGEYGAHRLTDRAPVVSTGAFYDAGDTASTGQPNYQAGLSRTIGFDASRSNLIYGNSTTVQPNATQFPYYIVLASGYKSSQVVDIDNVVSDINNIANEVNNKASKPTNTELWGGNSATSATIQDISNFDYILICGKTTRSGEYWTTAIYPVERILAEFNNGYQFRLVAFGGEANGNYEFGIRLTNKTSLTTYYTNLSWMRVMGIKF